MYINANKLLSILGVWFIYHLFTRCHSAVGTSTSNCSVGRMQYGVKKKTLAQVRPSREKKPPLHNLRLVSEGKKVDDNITPFYNLPRCIRKNMVPYDHFRPQGFMTGKVYQLLVHITIPRFRSQAPKVNPIYRRCRGRTR